MDIYQRLGELGLELPPPLPAGGLYNPDGTAVVGKVGRELTIEEGQIAARTCVMNALAALQEFLGDLNRVKRVIKVLGFVSSASGFNAQPKVIDGASELLAEIFGPQNGIGVRTAISAMELPLNLSVEIEFLFEVDG